MGQGMRFAASSQVSGRDARASPVVAARARQLIAAAAFLACSSGDMASMAHARELLGAHGAVRRGAGTHFCFTFGSAGTFLSAFFFGWKQQLQVQRARARRQPALLLLGRRPRLLSAPPARRRRAVLGAGGQRAGRGVGTRASTRSLDAIGGRRASTPEGPRGSRRIRTPDGKLGRNGSNGPDRSSLLVWGSQKVLPASRLSCISATCRARSSRNRD